MAPLRFRPALNRPGRAIRCLALGPASALLLPGVASACETCRIALATDPEAAGFSRGIYLSILMMLGVVFSLVAALVTYLVRQARLADRQEGSPRS